MPTRSRVSVALVTTSLLLAGAVLASSLPFGFVHHGNFQRMMHTGDTSGQVAIADLPRQAGSWGVGATAGLKGEIVQLDGELLVSPGSDERGAVRAPAAGEQAVLFAGGNVAKWVDVPVPSDMEQGQFEAFVVEQARSRGLSLEQPFVFRVVGRFPRMRWHVVTGESGAARHGDHGSGHSGHANKRSGMKVFHQPGAGGQVVGIYSGAQLEGKVSHPGERFHLHFVDDAVAVSGHVDAYAVSSGAVLKLPAQ